MRSDTVRAIVKWPAHSRSIRVSVSISRRRSATSRPVWEKSLNLVPHSSYAPRCWCTSQSTFLRMPREVGREFRRDDEIDIAAGRLRHVEQPPRFRACEQLLFRIVLERDRHDLRVVPARGERRGELAHQNLGAAVHEWHLRLQDQNAERCHSGCVAEVDNVAVLDDVFLAFEADLAVFAARRHRAARDERVVGDHLGADEAALDVACGFRRPPAARASRARSTRRGIRPRRR